MNTRLFHKVITLALTVAAMAGGMQPAGAPFPPAGAPVAAAPAAGATAPFPQASAAPAASAETGSADDLPF